MKVKPPRLAAVPSVVDTLTNPALFAPAFTPAASWAAWHTALKALFALPPTADDLARYQAHTGRATWPTTPAREAWLVVGRRGGEAPDRCADRHLPRGVPQLHRHPRARRARPRDGPGRRSPASQGRPPVHPGPPRWRPDARGPRGAEDGRGAAPVEPDHDRGPHLQLPRRPRLHRASARSSTRWRSGSARRARTQTPRS